MPLSVQDQPLIHSPDWHRSQAQGARRLNHGSEQHFTANVYRTQKVGDRAELSARHGRLRSTLKLNLLMRRGPHLRLERECTAVEHTNGRAQLPWRDRPAAKVGRGEAVRSKRGGAHSYCQTEPPSQPRTHTQGPVSTYERGTRLCRWSQVRRGFPAWDTSKRWTRCRGTVADVMPFSRG